MHRVEPQVGLQVAIQLLEPGVVRTPEADPAELGEDRALQPFHEAVRPRMPGACAAMLDAQLATSRLEFPVELRAAIGSRAPARQERVGQGGVLKVTQEWERAVPRSPGC